MKPGKLIGIGIGPGDPELLTIKAARILKSCGAVFTVISQHVDKSVSETVVRPGQACAAAHRAFRRPRRAHHPPYLQHVP